MITDHALDALSAHPERYAVLCREQRPGARWRHLGTFGCQSAATRFALTAMDNSPRHDWQVVREQPTSGKA